MRRSLITCLFAALPFVPLAQQASAQTLRVILREDADMLDPTLARSFVGRIVFAGLCDKLFDINDKLQIVPQLATSFEYTDPKTLLIHLRPGVKFQDETPMDAEAVKYSLMRHLTMKGSARTSEINAMDHVDVVDPLTVKVVLKAPSAPFVSQLTDRAGMIVSPKAAEAEGKDFALHPVCAGPMKFVERVAQDRIVLERFPDYWNKDAIHLDKVIYQPMPDSSVRLANLQSGAADIVEFIVPTDVDAVKHNPKLTLVSYDGLGYQGITYNLNNGPQSQTDIGKNALVRQAFDMSIDRDALMQVVYNGMFPATGQAVPPESPFYAADVKPVARNIDKAKALLKQAGVKLPVTVNLIAPNNPDIKQMAEVIQSMASEAGFDVKITAMEFASSLDAAQQGNFSAYLLAWSGRVDPDGSLYSFLHSATGVQNYGKYASPEMDKLLDDARLETDTAKRKALYADVARLTQKDVPISYIYTVRYLAGLSNKVMGFKPVSDGIIRLQGITLAP
jgi:peptide/nickel transport system substrate-binding protein